MGVATSQERSRAKMLRAWQRAGRTLSPSDAAWLARYADEHPSPRLARAAERAAYQAPPSAPDAPAIEQPPAQGAPTEPRVTIDFGEEQPAAHPLARVEERAPCAIPDCPECKRVAGADRCGVTGVAVYPPIDDDAAEAFGEMLLLVIGYLARAMRPDHKPVRPTERERAKMKNAVRKVAHRRANVLGAIDDVVMLTFASAAYGKRAFTEGSSGDAPPR